MDYREAIAVINGEWTMTGRSDEVLVDRVQREMRAQRVDEAIGEGVSVANGLSWGEVRVRPIL